MAHATVVRQWLPMLDQVGPFQFKTTLKVHPTVNETSVTRA